MRLVLNDLKLTNYLEAKFVLHSAGRHLFLDKIVPKRIWHWQEAGWHGGLTILVPRVGRDQSDALTDLEAIIYSSWPVTEAAETSAANQLEPATVGTIIEKLQCLMHPSSNAIPIRESITVHINLD